MAMIVGLALLGVGVLLGISWTVPKLGLDPEMPLKRKQLAEREPGEVLVVVALPPPV
jgi:hypothetical protein